MQVNKRIKAGVLPTVLFISIIFTVLSASLILFVYSQRLLFTKQKVASQLSLNARSGLNYGLANASLPYFEEIRFDLFNTGKDSVQVTRKYWGLYDLLVSTATRGNNNYREFALIGSQPDTLGAAALYLTDENRPLSLVGNTIIQGNAYLPKAGVKPAFINPFFFEGKTLVHGNVLRSHNQLPEINKAVFARITYYQNSGWVNSSNGFTSLPEIPANIVVNSFSQPTLVLKKPGPVTIQDAFLEGNIIVQSNKEIIVEKTAKLSNIILIAPKVILKKDFVGQLQVFATDSLVVEENCRLTYPSSIALTSSQSGYVALRKNSRVHGLVTVLSSAGNPSSVSSKEINRLEIEEGAGVVGSVYHDGFVQLKGYVFGNIVCRRFYLKTPITLYENHLLNVEINVAKRSGHFITSPLLSSSRKEIVAWVR